MDTLTKKIYTKYDRTCRETNIPQYYDTLNEKYILGLGSNMKKDTEYVTHKLKNGDTLDSLALKYYNNPTYWWVIAYFNDLQDAFVELTDKYSVIKIPSIASVKFGDER